MTSNQPYRLFIGGFVAAAAAVAFFGPSRIEPAQAQSQAQPQADRRLTDIPGLSRQPSPAARATMLDVNDAAVLLIDHQTGLFQTVKDIAVDT